VNSYRFQLDADDPVDEEFRILLPSELRVTSELIEPLNRISKLIIQELKQENDTLIYLNMTQDPLRVRTLVNCSLNLELRHKSPQGAYKWTNVTRKYPSESSSHMWELAEGVVEDSSIRFADLLGSTGVRYRLSAISEKGKLLGRHSCDSESEEEGCIVPWKQISVLRGSKLSKSFADTENE
jgi:hypothetical protein